MYTKQELEASAASKEDFFARRMAENENKPQGIPPSQGGKYVGFGSTPPPSANRNNGAAQGDVMQVVSQVKQSSLVLFSMLSVIVIPFHGCDQQICKHFPSSCNSIGRILSSLDLQTVIC
jgi:hypothetical protein